MGSKADGAARVRAHHRRQGGAREDARAGPECRVADRPAGGCCSSCRRRRAPARRRSSSGWSSSPPRLVSCRARTRRGRPAPGETDGVDYNFVSRARFEAMVAARRVPRVGRRVRQLYGTSRATPKRLLAGGRRCRAGDRRPGRAAGARARRRTRGVFVLPPSFEVLEQRLRGRSKDTEDAIQRRLEMARRRGRRVRRVRLRRRQRRARARVERLRAIVMAERARLRPLHGRDRANRQDFRERVTFPTGATDVRTSAADRAAKNAFEFVTIASARARQLVDGCVPKVEGSPKPARRALQEVATRRRRSASSDADESAPWPCIALGVTGGIGAYKAVEVARGLQKRGHDVVAVMTRAARGSSGRSPSRRSRGARSSPISSRRARTPTSSTSRSRRRIDLLLDRAGDRQHHRQARQRHRRRLPVDAVSGDARAGAHRAGDEHAHVRARGRAREPRYARGARRAVRRARRGLSGVRLDRQGPARRAGRRSSRPPRRCCVAAGRPLARHGACSSPRARRTRTSIPCASSATDRAGGWATRSPPRRARRGARVTLVAGPTGVEPPPVRRDRPRAQRRARCTRPSCRACGAADVVVMAAAVADYTPADGGAGAEDRRRRRPLTLVLERTPDILGRARRDAGGDRTRTGARRLRRGDRAIPSRAAAAQARSESTSTSSSPTTSRAPDAGFDVDDQRGHARRRPTATSRCRCSEEPRSPPTILDRVERLLASPRRARPGRDEPVAISSPNISQFFAELGVAGVSRDPAWRDACGGAGRERAAAGERARKRSDRGRRATADAGDGLERRRRRSPRFARDIGDCTRCKLHTLGRSRSSSASATRTPT